MGCFQDDTLADRIAPMNSVVAAAPHDLRLLAIHISFATWDVHIETNSQILYLRCTFVVSCDARLRIYMSSSV